MPRVRDGLILNCQRVNSLDRKSSINFPGMVVVVFADGRSLGMRHGKSVLRLKPGVEIYDADGKLVFFTREAVTSITLDGTPIAT